MRFLLILTLFLIAPVQANTDIAQPILATCNEAEIVCPEKSTPTCTGKKAPACIRVGKVYMPSCHIADDGHGKFSFSVNQVECLQGNKRLSL